ncbi:MAG: molybdenum cofactor guanylyltransferase [Nitrospirae bacterium]|nr:molybdenum cofactor guanylyltransferase [Nitrospirota bacterium]
MTGVILAGGENRRFPTLKGFIKIGDSTIIEKNLLIMKGMFDEVFISTNMPEKYFYLGVPLVGDALPSQGPMSGIYSALINAKGDCVFVVACDMPFIKKEVISLICDRHADLRSQAIDAVIPIYNNEPQPLFGVYCKTALPYLEEGIANKKTSLKRFLDKIKTDFIGGSDIRKIDPEGRSFVNINTPEDYEKLIAIS